MACPIHFINGFSFDEKFFILIKSDLLTSFFYGYCFQWPKQSMLILVNGTSKIYCRLNKTQVFTGFIVIAVSKETSIYMHIRNIQGKPGKYSLLRASRE